VRIGISILTKEEAEANPLGNGRQEPNMAPYLPKPEGRIELSLNPIKMLKQLIAPHIWMKCMKYLSGIICLALCIYLLPGLIDAIFGGMIVNWF